MHIELNKSISLVRGTAAKTEANAAQDRDISDTYGDVMLKFRNKTTVNMTHIVVMTMTRKRRSLPMILPRLLYSRSQKVGTSISSCP